MADPLALSGYRKVYVPTSKASVVSVYTAAEVDRLLLNYMPAYVAQEIEGIDVESYFVENVIIANTMVTNVLYAEYGRIARLSVSELNTAWKKITNYLLKDTDLAASTADVNYIRAYEQYIRWIAAETDGLATQHETDYDGNPLYWTDDTHTGMTTTANAFPVTTWVYTERIKREISFVLTGGYYVPIEYIGAGTGVGNNGKGYIYKDALNDLHVGVYHASTGKKIEILWEDDGPRKVGGAGDVQLRNIAHLAVDDALPDTLQDGDIVYQGFTASDKLELDAAATLYVQVDGDPEPTFIRFTGDGVFNVALPTDDGLDDGVELTFKNMASGTVTLTGTVDGATNYALTTGSFCTLRYNGTDWDRIG